jgi:hypothetical protein
MLRDMQSLVATLAWFCLQLCIGPLTYPRMNLAAAMMVDFFVLASCQLLGTFGPQLARAARRSDCGG